MARRLAGGLHRAVIVFVCFLILYLLYVCISVWPNEGVRAGHQWIESKPCIYSWQFVRSNHMEEYTLISRWLSFAGRVFRCSERHHDFSLFLFLSPPSSLLSACNSSRLHFTCSIPHSCLLGHDPSSLLSPVFRLLTFLFISFIANPPPNAFHSHSRLTPLKA